MVTHNVSVQHNTAASQTVSNRPQAMREAAAGTERTAVEREGGERVRQTENDRRIETAEENARIEEARLKREEQLENVVAVSEDGDTVQVSDEGNDERIESLDGNVLAREEAVAAEIPPERPEIEAPEIVAEETVQVEAREPDTAQEETAGQTVTTYAGISNQQLEQMYLDGEISRYDYDSEIQAREDRQEELRVENEDVNHTAMEIEARENFVTQSAGEIRRATADTANETLTAEQRLDMIDAARNGNTEEVRREEEQGRLWDYQLLT